MKELAQKIKGYQEQIASLNSKCKMLAVKAKHATMLLTVSDIEGQQEMDEEKFKKSSIQAIMVRKHIMYFVGCIVPILKQIHKFLFISSNLSLFLLFYWYLSLWCIRWQPVAVTLSCLLLRRSLVRRELVVSSRHLPSAALLLPLSALKSL